MSTDLNPPTEAEFAAAVAKIRTLEVPWYGKALYYLFPYRRSVVFGNFRQVFGDRLNHTDLVRVAQAYYGHYARFFIEFFKMPLMAAEKKKKFIRIENMESPIKAHEQGKGLILLTGHFGNWEVSTVIGIQQFPQFKGLFHFVRRPLKPELLNKFVTSRFRRAGFGTIAKRGSLDQILDLLADGAIVVYVFDQHAGAKDGIPVEFFGEKAGTFKSPALIAMASGAPVIPASSWREPDGTHVLRFEEPIYLDDSEDTSAAIRKNTRAFNAVLERMLLRHPDQWIWMHKRWKVGR